MNFIDKKEFAKIVLDKNNKLFIIYVIILLLIKKIIYLVY